MHIDAIPDARLPIMRTTLTIDDDLFAKAQALAEPGLDKSELLRECVRAFIQRQSARRLAALGGQAPDIDAAPRRRDEAPTPQTPA
jgi:Arc/MetJ family transcription regulator